MDYTFSPGDEVRFLSETGSGIVRGFNDDGTVNIETEDGFEMPYAVNQLVPRFDLVKEAPIHADMAVEEPIEKPPLTSFKGFKLGMTVSLVHDDLDGQVQGFDEEKELIQVEWDDLVTHWYRPQELVAMEHSQMEDMMESLEKVSLEDIGEKPERLSTKGVMKDRKDQGVWEVDLHIQEIVDNSYGMMNYEIVQKQLDHFDKKLNEAIDKDLRKVIFIHGRGEGKLKTAIRQVLERYPNCECLDADYRRYGVGATEVRIKHRRVEQED